MRAWALLLAGLLVWAAHFFVLYAIASVLPGQAGATWAVIAATAVAVAAISLILRRTRAGHGEPDAMDRWVAYIARLGAALALIAVLWQAFPALLV